MKSAFKLFENIDLPTRQARQLSFCDFGDGWEVVGTYDEELIKELYVQLKEKFKGE